MTSSSVPRTLDAPALQMAERFIGSMQPFRLHGVGVMHGHPCLAQVPPAVLLGHRSRNVPYYFAATSDGVQLRIEVGSSSGSSTSLANALRTVTGGKVTGAAGSFMPHTVRGWSTGMLFGIPGANEQQNGIGCSPLDLLADVLTGTEWIYLVMAVPEERSAVAVDLRHLRNHLQHIDQVLLRTGQLDGSHRPAKRTADILEERIRYLERGCTEGGLWRAAVLLATADPSGSAEGLAALAGALAPRGESTLPAVRPVGCPPSEAGAGHQLTSGRITSTSLAAFCSLPSRSRQGFTLIPNARHTVHIPESLREGIAIGTVMDGNRLTNTGLCLPEPLLSRHLFVAGATGSGKTTTVCGLLERLSAHGVPFLVIEPAKSEYADRLAHLDDLSVYRVSARSTETDNPFLFNPFQFPDGCELTTHIDHLRAAMVAGFGLFPPGPFLVEAALYRVYESYGWDLSTGLRAAGRDRLAFPTISDLLHCVEQVVEDAGYHAEITDNLRAALRTRLTSLTIGAKGLCFDTRDGLDDDELLGGPVVIELEQLGSDEEKALAIGFILSRLYEFRRTRPAWDGRSLRHLLVIEEAHRLLRKNAARPQEDGNMQASAIETFSSMLAEVRVYGQGVAVVEQLPSRIEPTVVKNAVTRIVHRLGPKDDREFIGGMMGLSAEQSEELCHLDTGVAVVHTNRLNGPVKISVENVQNDGSVGQRKKTRAPRHVRQRTVTAVQRHRHRALIDSGEVAGAADGLLLTLLLAQETSMTAAAAHRLREAIDTMAPARATGSSGHRPLEDLALSASLERLAISEQFSDDERVTLDKYIPDRPHQLAEKLSSRLTRGHGSHRFCGKCSQQCRCGWFCRKLSGTKSFQEDLIDLLEAPGENGDLDSALVSFVRDQLQDRHGIDHTICQVDLIVCTAAHGLQAIGVRSSAIERQATAIRAS